MVISKLEALAKAAREKTPNDCNRVNRVLLLPRKTEEGRKIGLIMMFAVWQSVGCKGYAVAGFRKLEIALPP